MRIYSYKLKMSVLGALLSSLVMITSLQACIHPPVGYTDVVTEKTKEALVFHDGKNAHLVIKTELQSEGVLPPSMAWVIPLPSLPVSYKEERADLFEKLYELIPSPPPPGGPAPGAAMPASDPGGIRIHAVQTVGNYRVQPIEILSETSGDELNQWLTHNGFGAVPPKNQKYYLKKGAVFLTLKLKGLGGSRSEIKPLHIVYPSNSLSVPLKFSSHSGVFNLMLYTWSKQPLKTSTTGTSYMYLQGENKIDTRWVPVLRQILGTQVGYLTLFKSQKFNAEGWEVTSMETDPTIDMVTPGILRVAPSKEVNSASPRFNFSKFVLLFAVLASTIVLIGLKLRRNKKTL